jgi:hypothetical protein
MNKRLLLNLLMLIGVLALIAVVVYKPGIAPPVENPPLTNLDVEQINRIDITRTDHELTLERRADGWWISGEPATPADPIQVGALLRLLDARPVRSYPASELDLEQLQLAPAQTTLKLDSTEFRFGATDPLDNLRYVQLGDEVHLLQDNYQHILQGQRAQFTSRKLLPEGAVISTIQLPDRTLARQEEGGWSVEPAPEKLSADAAQKLVQAWTNANALWVRTYQTAPNGKPVLIGLADGRQIRFELHQAEGETLLARPDLGLQYQMPEESAKPLLELETAVELEEVPDEAPGEEVTSP